MAEYLEREALLKSLTQECKDCDNNFGYDCEECDYAHAILYVKAERAADVQPVKHGRWTYPYKDKDINQCSECHSYVQDKISNVREMFAYCPFCGARMEQEG